MTEPQNNAKPPRTRLTARREQRLTRRDDISRVFDAGRRVADRRLTLLAARQEQPTELAPARLAVAVSVRHGNAVRRNRLKRLCREAFRMVRPELPQPFDYVLIPRAGVDLTLAEIQASIRVLAAKATKAAEAG